jgi:hypothetical protein
MSDVTQAIEGNVISYKWQDLVNLGHAIWIFGSPWWLGFAGMTLASWNHWAVAVLVGAIAIISLPRAKVWKEGIIIVAGAWLFISPWVLHFTNDPNARWNAWMLGALLMYVASWALTDLIRLSHPPRR